MHCTILIKHRIVIQRKVIVLVVGRCAESVLSMSMCGVKKAPMFLIESFKPIADYPTVMETFSTCLILRFKENNITYVLSAFSFNMLAFIQAILSVRKLELLELFLKTRTL